MEFTEEQKQANRSKLTSHLVERQDRDNPQKPQAPLQANEILKDEDENTLAKSIMDQIIAETESEPDAPLARHPV